MSNDKQLEEYIQKCLLSFLGFETDVYVRSKNVLYFYHWRFGKIIFYPKKNKVNIPQKKEWIDNAHEFILRKILRKKECPTFEEYRGQTLF